MSFKEVFVLFFFSILAYTSTRIRHACVFGFSVCSCSRFLPVPVFSGASVPESALLLLCCASCVAALRCWRVRPLMSISAPSRFVCRLMMCVVCDLCSCVIYDLFSLWPFWCTSSVLFFLEFFFSSFFFSLLADIFDEKPFYMHEKKIGASSFWFFCCRSNWLLPGTFVRTYYY